MSAEPVNPTARTTSARSGIVEVFADIICPFTHVGLRRLVSRRAELGRDDVRLWVRSWPLEVVNGRAPDPQLLAEEIDEIREQVAPDLFAGFDVDAFPSTSVPALALAHQAYARDIATGEVVSLELRTLLFERGVDISDPDVLRGLAERHGLGVSVAGSGGDVGDEVVDTTGVLSDHREGLRRGVVGSPHFFTPAGSFFCPALAIHRDDDHRLHVDFDTTGFEAFFSACFG